MPTLSAALRAEYQQLFDTCQINQDSASVVDKMANQIMGSRKPSAARWPRITRAPWNC